MERLICRTSSASYIHCTSKRSTRVHIMECCHPRGNCMIGNFHRFIREGNCCSSCALTSCFFFFFNLTVIDILSNLNYQKKYTNINLQCEFSTRQFQLQFRLVTITTSAHRSAATPFAPRGTWPINGSTRDASPSLNHQNPWLKSFQVRLIRAYFCSQSPTVRKISFVFHFLLLTFVFAPYISHFWTSYLCCNLVLV